MSVNEYFILGNYNKGPLLWRQFLLFQNMLCICLITISNHITKLIAWWFRGVPDLSSRPGAFCVEFAYSLSVGIYFRGDSLFQIYDSWALSCWYLSYSMIESTFIWTLSVCIQCNYTCVPPYVSHFLTVYSLCVKQTHGALDIATEVLHSKHKQIDAGPTKAWTPVWLNVLWTFILLRTIWRLGVWNGVIHTAVLPSVVCVTDTLHLITACLRQREAENI